MFTFTILSLITDVHYVAKISVKAAISGKLTTAHANSCTDRLPYKITIKIGGFLFSLYTEKPNRNSPSPSIFPFALFSDRKCNF